MTKLDFAKIIYDSEDLTTTQKLSLIKEIDEKIGAGKRVVGALNGAFTTNMIKYKECAAGCAKQKGIKNKLGVGTEYRNCMKNCSQKYYQAKADSFKK